MRLLIVDEEIIAGGVDTLRRQLVPALAELVEAIVWVLPGYAAEGFRGAISPCGNVALETLNSPSGLGRLKEAVTRRMAGGVPRKLVDERLRRLGGRCDICMTTCAFSQQMPDVGLPVAGFVSDINPALPQRIRDNILMWVERSAATFAISEFTAEELKRLRPDCSNRIYPIPLAAPASPTGCDGTKAGSFYYPAAPNAHKGHLVALEAARGLAGRGLDYRLTFTGPGMDAFARADEGNEVIRSMRSLLAEDRAMDGRVVVAGDANRTEVERLFAEASCVVLPSAYEGYGFPLAEALARGKRVICTDIAPFREQIERHGFEALATVVPAGDAAALEEAMAAHLAGRNGPGLTAEEVGERLGRWTWKDAARRCVDLLEEARRG